MKFLLLIMDLTQFNKDLGKKINQARLFEKNENIEQAIKIWIEISDMTLKASKDSSLNISYRTMLITKTEEIVKHIKELKEPKPMEIKSVRLKPAQKISEHIDGTRELQKKIEPMKNSDLPVRVEKKEKIESDLSQETMNASHLTKLPDGFKEIEAPADFKIVTPHDPDIVKERLNQADKIDEFFSKISPITSEGKESLDDANRSHPHIEVNLDNISQEGNIICFACGFDKNPKDASLCSNCGAPF